MMKRFAQWALVLAIGSAFCAVALEAQAPGTGAIRGTVVDQSGQPVLNATVLLVNRATRATRTVMTSRAGAFGAALLMPGSYTVTASAQGFAEARAENVAVVVSETSTLDFRLEIATGTTTIEVTATRELADTESSTLGRAVDEEAIQSLPLANRNFTQILSLSPGVIVGLPDATTLGRGTQNVMANGSKTTANNIQFNGVDANNLAQNSAMNDLEEVGVAIPAPDTIEEFKVQTANYDATYGRGTGANVDVVSKSGSNQWHGRAWEFLRNDLLNANDFFAKLTGQPRPVLKQNQFGAALGGPVVRDRTFFFAAYQGLHSSNGEGDVVTTNLPQLTDDRSAATLGAQFCAYPTFAGGTQLKCDGSNIHPVALALLNHKFANGKYAIPNPQIVLPSSDPTTMPIGESTFATPASYREGQYTLNLDQILTAKNVLAARVFYSRAPTLQPFSLNAANVPGWGTNEVDKNVMAVVSDTHTVSAALVNVARLGYMRFDGVAAVANPISTADVGTVSPTGLSGSAISAPGITIDGLFTIGDAGTPSQAQRTNSFIAQDTVSLIRGRNYLRAGGEVKRHQVMVDAPFSLDGLLDIRTFSDFLLGESAAQNGSPDGLSNVTLSNGSSGIFRKDERYNDFASFAQDDFKMTPRLMLNVGLRYEIFGPPSEVHGWLVTFDPALATLDAPPEGTLSGYVAPSNYTGVLPDGVVKTGRRGLWATRFTDVSPRLGFALQIARRPELIVRGGYGIYFDRLSAGMAESLVSQAPYSTFQFISGAQNGPASLDAPFTPLLPSMSSYPIFTPRIPGGGPTVVGVATHVMDPYTEEYNVNLQTALGGNLLAEVGYVGTRSLHVAGSVEFNQAVLASPENAINGEITNSVNNVIQRVPYAGVAPGSLVSETAFMANYNALQASLTRRLSRGLQFQGSYTWSRTLDETSGSSGNQVFELWLITNDQRNPRQNYGPTDFDRTHRAVINFSYALPGLRNAPRLLRQVTSDWQAAGIFVAQSGTPITILDFSAGAVYGNYSFENRAQLSGGRIATSGSLHDRVLAHYLDANAFTNAPMAPNAASASDTDFGNSGVGAVRGAGQHNLDFSLERTLHIAESHSVHVRAEFLNLTNTPNFANPLNIVGTGEAFGKITAKSNNPRIVQLALKYQF
ncbi:MAG TPA: carboxypeptidase regulatory-like domain-containing protein [Terracidiphilus sp.]|nr:carboxypeptidase regulatory-like domain-containing protein [Terracidiphilus sp.]